MDTLLVVVHVIVCLFLIGVVLLQHGKGADIGASFGGSSQSLFGTEGPLPLLNKITTASAIIFMLTSVTLAYISSTTGTSSVMSDLSRPVAPSAEVAQPAAEGDKTAGPTEGQAEQAPAAPEEGKTTTDEAPKQ